ncbi:glycosyltransferase family 4 protein [Vibrio hibernica]|uniref:glycosyltransferase family 4 protein n=1 Tax=Vibrio hibernica TaxID=2587465 RepID=UPI0039B00B3E
MKTIHMIPMDGLGGVEQAARSLIPDETIDIETVFMCGKKLSEKKHIKTINESGKLNSLSFYFKSFKYLLKSKPDILICSLWRSSIVGILYWIFNFLCRKKKVKLVVFLHSNKYAHIVDRFITKVAILLSTEIWCDSEATRIGILSNNNSDNIKVISFFIKIPESNYVLETKRNNNFVFWGRIAKQKRIDLAILIFKELSDKYKDILFYIYGPDCGGLYNLVNLVKKLNLEERVLFMGKKKINDYPMEIRNSKFFINTSSHEGMAIAVVEAMQLGLVPIVTPVGEVGSYCTDKENSIYFNKESIEVISNIINDSELHKKYQQSAFNYWNRKKVYSTDFNENCNRLIHGSSN